MALGSANAQQTMWVHQGQVHYAYTTSQLDTMPVVDATSLTVLGKTFELAQVDSINVTSEEVADNAIGVSYAGDKAQVVVSGNIATHIEATVVGQRFVLSRRLLQNHLAPQRPHAHQPR